MNQISIMLIDDNPGFLRATTQFLEAQKDMTVIGAVEGGAEAVADAMKPEAKRLLAPNVGP